MSRSEAGKLGAIAAKAGIESAKLSRRAKYTPNLCPQCDKEIPFLIRRNTFCDSSCAASYSNRVNPRRRGARVECKECSEVFLVKQREQACCSHKCSVLYKHKKAISEWLEGTLSGGSWHGVRTFVRKWLAETFGNACIKCGWCEVHPITGRIPLHVDHINGDSSDHQHSNLRLLCPNCHSLTPTFGILNKGNGRKERYPAK